MARNGRPNYCIATRAQVITLKEVGQTNKQISETTGVSIRHIRQLYANALNRGYDPAVSKQLKDEYFVEAPRSGRPKKITESLKQEVLQSVRKSRKGRTQTLIELARETGGPRSLKGVGYMSIHRILRQAGMKKVKPRMGLRNIRGVKPTWKFDKAHGAITREKGHGGVDWYRYQKFVLVPKMIPFAQECTARRPGTLVQEDGAASHKSKHQQVIYDTANIKKLVWCGNSPDLNMIEPCWPFMKKRTCQHRDFEQRGKLLGIWEATWDKIEQERIQHWIERIPRHIQEVIRLEGGNEYQEGAEERSRRFNWRKEQAQNAYSASHP